MLVACLAFPGHNSPGLSSPSALGAQWLVLRSLAPRLKPGQSRTNGARVFMASPRWRLVGIYFLTANSLHMPNVGFLAWFHVLLLQAPPVTSYPSTHTAVVLFFVSSAGRKLTRSPFGLG